MDGEQDDYIKQLQEYEAQRQKQQEEDEAKFQLKLKELESMKEARMKESQEAEAEEQRQAMIKAEEEAGDDQYGQTNYAQAVSHMDKEQEKKQQWVPKGEMDKLDLQLKQEDTQDAR